MLLASRQWGRGTGVGGPWTLPGGKGGLTPQPELLATNQPRRAGVGVGTRGGTGGAEPQPCGCSRHCQDARLQGPGSEGKAAAKERRLRGQDRECLVSMGAVV